MATVHYIAKNGGGCVWVETQQQKGSTFSVYLPALNESGERPKRNHDGPQYLLGAETILVAGTPEALEGPMPELLEKLGYTVLLADDAEKAHQIIENQRNISALVLGHWVVRRQ